VVKLETTTPPKNYLAALKDEIRKEQLLNEFFSKESMEVWGQSNGCRNQEQVKGKGKAIPLKALTGL
jgi:hypothetical protein